jgi:hypothetical protein
MGRVVSKALWLKYRWRQTDMGTPIKRSEIGMKIASWYRLMIHPVNIRCSNIKRGVAQEMIEYNALSMFSIKHAADTMSTPEATCERSQTCLISSVHPTTARPLQKLAGDGSSFAALNLTLPSTLATGECGPVDSRGDMSNRD